MTRENKMNKKNLISSHILNQTSSIHKGEDRKKAEAIDYDNWKIENDWKWEMDDFLVPIWYQDNEEGKSELKTTDQLYEIYQQQLNAYDCQSRI